MKNVLLAIVSLAAVQAFAGLTPKLSAAGLLADSNSISYRDFDVVHEYLGEVEIDKTALEYNQYLATKLCPGGNSYLMAQAQTQLFSLSPRAIVEVVNGVDILIDKIIAIGSKVMNIISKGNIDPCYQDKVLHVLPDGVTEATLFQTVTGWSKPMAKAYSLTLMSRNIPGRKVVRFAYQIVATQGGSVNGRGKYLANVHVLPIKEPNVSFRWGLDVKVNSLAPVNLSSDKGDPVAGIEISVDYIAKPKLFGATRIGSAGFFIDGDGNIDKICAVNSKSTRDAECISAQVED